MMLFPFVYGSCVFGNFAWAECDDAVVEVPYKIYVGGGGVERLVFGRFPGDA